MARPSKYNWEAIKEAYEGGFDRDEICRTFNINKKQLSNRVNSDKWNHQVGKTTSKIKAHIKKNKTNPFNGCDGYIYIIRCIDTNNNMLYKIGQANNPKERIASIQTGNPFPVEILLCFYVKNTNRVEKELHYIFRNLRLNGEWFELNDEKIESIREFIVKECR